MSPAFFLRVERRGGEYWEIRRSSGIGRVEGALEKLKALVKLPSINAEQMVCIIWTLFSVYFIRLHVNIVKNPEDYLLFTMKKLKKTVVSIKNKKASRTDRSTQTDLSPSAGSNA